MGFKLLTPKQVSAANTATALATTNTPCCYLVIQADKDNLDAVYVGDSTVSSTSDRGIILSVTSGTLFVPKLEIGLNQGANTIDLAQVYISSAHSGSKVNVFYCEG